LMMQPLKVISQTVDSAYIVKYIINKWWVPLNANADVLMSVPDSASVRTLSLYRAGWIFKSDRTFQEI